jgi:TatD DNase family protein
MSGRHSLSSSQLDALTWEDGSLFHDVRGRAVEFPAPLAPLADTHGHLTVFREHDAANALARAALAGVRLLVVPVDPADDVRDVPRFLDWFESKVDEARGLLDRYASIGLVPPEFPDRPGLPQLLDNVWIVAGVHPYGAVDHLDDPSVGERLSLLLDSPRCVGVGEIGVDLGPYSDVPLDAQERALRDQLRVARERDLPVELHVRDARDDEAASAHALVERVLREEGVPRRGCDLHCFTQGPEVMAPFVELGSHVAFGGAETFRSSDDVRQAAVECPERLILSETDSPYMAPVPLRGEECEEAMVAFSAASLAQVREDAGIASRQRTYDALWDNARALFSL